MINYLKEGNELSATQIFFDKFISKKKLTQDNKKPNLGTPYNWRVKSEEKIINQINEHRNNLKSQKKDNIKNIRQKSLTFNKQKELKIFQGAKEIQNLDFFTIKSKSNNFFRIKGLRISQQLCNWDPNKIQKQKKDSKISLDKQAKNTKAFSYLNQVKQKIKANFNIKSIPFTYHQSTDIFRIPKSNLPNITKVAIVNCLSLKFVQDFINEKYTRIQYCQTLKKYRLSLNQFKTDFRSNLFFCILSSEQKLIEYFFWLGIPIRSQEKQHIKSEIQNFFVQIINQQGQLSDFVKLNQGKNVILMDQKGRISYLQQNLIVECAQRVKVKQRERADSKYLKSSITAYLA